VAQIANMGGVEDVVAKELDFFIGAKGQMVACHGGDGLRIFIAKQISGCDQTARIIYELRPALMQADCMGNGIGQNDAHANSAKHQSKFGQ
jgi:hypothetical protein